MVVDVLCLWFQIQDLPPQKMRGPRDQQQAQVPEMEKLEEGVLVLLPHAGDTGIPLLGQKKRTELAHCCLTDSASNLKFNSSVLQFFYVCVLLFIFFTI